MQDDLLFLEDDFHECGMDECVKFWQILIVDDDEAVFDVTKLALNGYCFNNAAIDLFYVESAKAAMELLSQQEFAVLLVDMIMEEDDAGIQVVRHVRETLQNSHTRIIMRSGQPGKMDIDECYRADINEFVHKTDMTNDKLKTLMQRHLRDYTVSSWYLEQLAEKNVEISRLKTIIDECGMETCS